MAAIEKLLTKGLAHGVDPTRMLLAAGGTQQPDVDRITWEDVTRAVVTLPLAQRAALYLKCAPELSSANELASFTNDLLLVITAHDARRCSAYSPAEERSGYAFERQAAIVRTAVEEYMDPRTCRRCQGEGTVLDYVPERGMVKGTCGRCEGKGWRPWSDNQRSRRCGVRRTDWAPKYAAGYQRVMDSCTATYKTAAGAFKAVLFGSEQGIEYDRVEERLQAGV